MFLQKGQKTKFATGSSYLGSWNHIGVTVAGIYRFPDGMLYDGRLRDGQFDGCGTLFFPQGHIIIGHWVKGVVKSMSFVFADGLKFDESNWTYCTDGDRRYLCAHFRRNLRNKRILIRYAWDELKSLPPIGKHNININRSENCIPNNCYITGEGFYNPKTKCIYNAKNPTEILRIPTATEEQWILARCQKSWSETIGYRKELIEENLLEPAKSGIIDFPYVN